MKLLDCIALKTKDAHRPSKSHFPHRTIVWNSLIELFAICSEFYIRYKYLNLLAIRQLKTI
jgi:hypothetical protein